MAVLIVLAIFAQVFEVFEFGLNNDPQAALAPYDVLIVGTGLSGAVIAYLHANILNHTVLLIDKRNHTGGNVYDFVDSKNGDTISLYG